MLIQTALTYAFEAISVIGISGIVVHAFYTSHCQWMAANCPPVKPFQDEAIAHVTPVLEVETEVKPEGEEVTKAIPVFELVAEVLNPQLRLQPLSVGAAAADYSVMTTEQLRKQCALQDINWRTGNDHRKPMRKMEM